MTERGDPPSKPPPKIGAYTHLRGQVHSLLGAVRRRLRWTWAMATAQWAGPFVGVMALVMVLAGRRWPWAWPEPVALALAVVALVLVGLTSLVIRIPELVAARAADRGLDTRDAFATAVELADEPGELPDRVRARAQGIAAGATARDAIPVPVAGRRLFGIAGVGLAAVALAVLPNHQDDVRRDRAADEAAMDAAAEEARDTAAETEDADARERLEQLAQDLERAGSLDEGLAELDAAQQELQSQVPTGHLAQKAAARGLDRSLEAAPLADGLSGDASDQLAELAAGLSDLSPEEQAALAERLVDLATSQSVGNPAASEALSQAAEALSAGDLSTAEAALGEAAAAQGDASAAVDAAEAAQAAADAVGDLASDLADSADGDGEGSGGESSDQQATRPCPPQLDPEDRDDDGDRDEDGDVDENDAPCLSGSGQGSGSGSGGGQGGQGQGSQSQGGQGGGAASGNVAGAGGGTGSGQGGQGQSAGTGTSGDESRGSEADPDDDDPDFGEGDQLDAEGSSSNGRPGETQGRESGPTRSGQVTVSPALQEAYADALAQARDSTGLPPTLADVFRAYFENLNELYQD